MKKIAVCGYTSNVGRYFVQKYRNQYEFVLIGRQSDADIYLDLGTRKIDGNVELLKNCDSLVNFSAQTSAQTDQQIMNLMTVNALGSLYLATLVKQYQINYFLNMSSISATYKIDDEYYGYYSQSKKSADEVLSYYCKKNDIKLCVLQPTAIFGTPDFAKHQVLLYGLISKVEANQPIEIYGTVDAKRNYIHIETLAEVIGRSLQYKIEGVYPVLNGRNDSITNIISALNDYYGSSSEYSFRKDRPNIVERCFEKQDAIYRILGMDMPNGFGEELRKMKLEY